MKHYDFLTTEEKATLFFKEPLSFDKNSNKNLLAASLGATLYSPATRPNLLQDLRKIRGKDGTSSVICLEDSIPDEKVEEAEQNLHKLLVELNELENLDGLPLLFVRPRDPKHFAKIAKQNTGLLHNLTGFVFPKFDDFTGRARQFTDELNKVNKKEKINLYYMPVLETPSLLYRETREAALNGIAQVVARNSSNLLSLRIGATDMASHYALRRSSDFTVYDVHVISSAIADIVNVLGRAENGYNITGAVWEHFQPSDRTFKPQLREALFNGDKTLRRALLTQGYDTFIREIQMDKINGINGKTVIYPSHIGIVHSLLVVSHEEYSDALTILDSDNQGGGAYSSEYRNKMNEVKPHLAWAQQTVARAEAFGVANKEVDFVDFLERFNGFNG